MQSLVWVNVNKEAGCKLINGVVSCLLINHELLINHGFFLWDLITTLLAWEEFR